MTCSWLPLLFFFFFNDPATTEIYTLSLHDALPIFELWPFPGVSCGRFMRQKWRFYRSEEHTSELQSQSNLVCRLLLEKKKDEELADDRRVQSRAAGCPTAYSFEKAADLDNTLREAL